MRLGQRKESVTRRVVAAGRRSLEPQPVTCTSIIEARSTWMDWILSERGIKPGSTRVELGEAQRAGALTAREKLLRGRPWSGEGQSSGGAELQAARGGSAGWKPVCA